MRVKEEPLLLQIAHGVADRSRRNAEPKPTGQRPRAGGLCSFNITSDHRFEHAALAPAELF
jgi:hypothetical protein